MSMTAIPMCAEQYLNSSLGPGSGRTSPTWNSLKKSPVSVSEKNIRPDFMVAAGCQGRSRHSVIGGQPSPKDSSTVFRTVPSLLNITEWKKSTAPGMFPVPPELNSSSMIEIGLAVSGIPSASISHT